MDTTIVMLHTLTINVKIITRLLKNYWSIIGDKEEIEMAKLLVKELMIDGLYIGVIIGVILSSLSIAAQIVDVSMYTYHQYQLTTTITALTLAIIIGLIIEFFFKKKDK